MSLLVLLSETVIADTVMQYRLEVQSNFELTSSDH